MNDFFYFITISLTLLLSFWIIGYSKFGLYKFNGISVPVIYSIYTLIYYTISNIYPYLYEPYNIILNIIPRASPFYFTIANIYAFIFLISIYIGYFLPSMIFPLKRNYNFIPSFHFIHYYIQSLIFCLLFVTLYILYYYQGLFSGEYSDFNDIDFVKYFYYGCFVSVSIIPAFIFILYAYEKKITILIIIYIILYIFCIFFWKQRLPFAIGIIIGLASYVSFIRKFKILYYIIWLPILLSIYIVFTYFKYNFEVELFETTFFDFSYRLSGLEAVSTILESNIHSTQSVMLNGLIKVVPFIFDYPEYISKTFPYYVGLFNEGDWVSTLLAESVIEFNILQLSVFWMLVGLLSYLIDYLIQSLKSQELMNSLLVLRYLFFGFLLANGGSIASISLLLIKSLVPIAIISSLYILFRLNLKYYSS